jgi:hypothetical protein
VRWQQLFDRLAGRAAPSDPRTVILHVIRQLREQQRDLDRRAGVAYAGTARVEREVQSQQRFLRTALADVETAVAAARQAAETARAEGADATPYEQTVAGLRAQGEVLAASGEQLAGLRGGAHQNAERTGELLAGNRHRIARALREQLSLLQRLDELERRRTIARYRGRPDQPGAG